MLAVSSARCRSRPYVCTHVSNVVIIIVIVIIAVIIIIGIMAIRIVIAIITIIPSVLIRVARFRLLNLQSLSVWSASVC